MIKQSIRRNRGTIGTLGGMVLLAAALLTGLAEARPVSPLVRVLPKAGEIKEFVPGRPRVFPTVAAIREVSGATPAASELKRYTEEGFVEAAIARLHDAAEPSAGGVSSVFGFETSAGASEELEAEFRAMRKEEADRIKGSPFFAQRRFTVPGVPGALGLAIVSNRAAAKHGLEGGVAKGFSVEGSCLITIGIFRPGSKEVIGPVVKGVQSVSSRGMGSCR